MRRLVRSLFALCSAVSLLLCITLVAAWVMSYWAQPTVSWTEPQRLAGAGVARGAVFYGLVQQPPGGRATFGPPHGRRFLMVRPPVRDTGGPNALTADHALAGFVYRARTAPLTYLHLAVPCWALAAGLAVCPLAWLLRRRRAWRRDARSCAGRCRQCGYDLRGSPSRCPECGTVPDAADAAGAEEPIRIDAVLRKRNGRD